MLQVPQHYLPQVTSASTARVLHRDYETRGRLVLKSVGVHRYAADAGTDVLCCAFSVDDEPVQLWIPGDPVPPEFLQAALDPNWVVCAHNDAFETAIEQHILAPRYELAGDPA
jgi:DNA polymerase